MLIAGFQKLTLLDYPGRCAATIFTPGCDLRCPFCHNASLVKDANQDIYDQDKILDYLKERKGKITGLAITGGEPLLQTDIINFMRKVKDIGVAIKLDTNGTYPTKLETILNEGLVDYVAMDIKSSYKKYPELIGLSSAPNIIGALLDNIKKSIEMLKNSGIEYEFRTTLVKPLHTEADIIAMAKEIGPVPKYFVQNFKDSGDILAGSGEKCQFEAFTKKELDNFINLIQIYVPSVQLRGVD